MKAERPGGFSDSPYFLPRLPSPASIRADRSEILTNPFDHRQAFNMQLNNHTIPTRKLPPYLGHLPGLSGSGCDCSDVSKYKSPHIPPSVCLPFYLFKESVCWGDPLLIDRLTQLIHIGISICMSTWKYKRLSRAIC